MCVSVCRRADIRTCVGHSDFMTPLFPSPVVSVWFIQWQTQSQTITLASNDSAVSLEEVKEEIQGGWKLMNNVGWERLKTQNNTREEVGTLHNFPLTYTGLISTVLGASVVLLWHLHLRDIGKQWGYDAENHTNTHRWGRARMEYKNNGQINRILESMSESSMIFFLGEIALWAAQSSSEWNKVDDLFHMVGISWNAWNIYSQ